MNHLRSVNGHGSQRQGHVDHEVLLIHSPLVSRRPDDFLLEYRYPRRRDLKYTFGSAALVKLERSSTDGWSSPIKCKLISYNVKIFCMP